MSLPSDHESSEVVQPGERPFDLPTMSIASKGTTILRSFLSIAPVGRDHLDPPFEQQPFVERIALVGLVADQALGLHVEKSAVEGFVNESDFSW